MSGLMSARREFFTSQRRLAAGTRQNSQTKTPSHYASSKMLKVPLLVVLVVCAASLGVGQARCPDGYWADEDDTKCIRTSFDVTMTLTEAEQYCVGLQGRLFEPTASNTGMLKRYVDDVYLANPARWRRYWVSLTKDLSDAWQRNVVDRGNSGPFCVALDYRRPINAQQVSFYGYDSRSCLSDVNLPAICVVDATVEVPAAPEGILGPPEECPEPEPCPECPAPVECPVVDCPAVEPCEMIADPAPPPPSVCPETWFTRRGFCYHFIIESKTWQAASDSCGKDEAYLVSVLDREENDFLITVSNDLSEASPSMRRFWIGMNDKEQEGVMTWPSGEPVGFTSWGPRQPSVHKKRRFEENCVVINSQNVGLWDDISCWRRHPYICKKPAKSPR